MNNPSVPAPELKTIKLPCYSIVIELNGKSGALTSALHDGEAEEGDDSLYDAAADAVESMILAHAIAGIDVTSEAYVKGVVTAVDSITNAYA